MKYETIKSFILVVLVGLSFLLSFILWSYQPNYENFYDTSYISEVDIGGNEKGRNEIIAPNKIIFKHELDQYGFKKRNEQLAFYERLSSWTLFDYSESETIDVLAEKEKQIEVIFETSIPVSLLPNLFLFHEEIIPGDWSFRRMYITIDEENHSMKVRFRSVDERIEATATIEKKENIEYVGQYFRNNKQLEEYITLNIENNPVYLPKNGKEMDSNTVVALHIEPDRFINALFTNPSLVTQNHREAYFTDGQRGMRIVHGNNRLEFINPLEVTSERLNSADLLEKSLQQINEHKGWTNDYFVDEIRSSANFIRFRLHYNGTPVFTSNELASIEQKWTEQELAEYNRPLVWIGNLLNSKQIELISGEEIVQVLQNIEPAQRSNIQDIQQGYSLEYMEDRYSLLLKPNWFINIQGEWVEYQHGLFQDIYGATGGSY